MYRSSRLALLLVASTLVDATWSQQQSSLPSATQPSFDRALVEQFVGRYCADCHNSAVKTAGIDIESISTQAIDANGQTWEKVVRKLAMRQMPPTLKRRPEERTYNSIISSLETALDGATAARPHPGRTPTFRRLNRTEYQNAVRDLLALDIDATAMLPSDESSHGFDNLTQGDLSPTLLDRYVSAAQKIARLAVGDSHQPAGSDTFRIRPDRTQEEQADGLPLGTRGGTVISYIFPQNGEYDIQLWLSRDRNEQIEGLSEPHELEVLLDDERVAGFSVTPSASHNARKQPDDQLKARIPVTAGPHQLGVTFLKNPSSLLETKRQPYQAHYNLHRHPRITPAIYQVTITGPYDNKSPGDTPSRRRIFICRPGVPVEEEDCAKRILATLMRRAYRRPVTDADLEAPLKLYHQARAGGDFDAGIEMSLSCVLVNPQFLIHIEHEPADIAPRTAYRVNDLDLASRLSFFLWSSIPDDELLNLAERNQLSKPGKLKQQVLRMLADPRSKNLATNFASQWLYLRNLDSITPDLRQFPDFDDNLRQSFRQETELFFESVMREDRSVLDFLRADYTYLNERLARHYDIPYVYGNHFRRVALARDSQRGGLLRQGSVLTVTSYATRTSPVIRGKWILENLLGSPPPRPPPNVPVLKDNIISAKLSVRERLAQHRADPTCARCHQMIDPVGFSLEQFDAIGHWRTAEEDKPVDASGALPDGSPFTGATGLEQALLNRPEIFVRTLIEKLLTFALGREVEYYDAPAVRTIIRDARAQNYRFSAIVLGIVGSEPFQLRSSE